jgi:phage-related minor tail protein
MADRPDFESVIPFTSTTRNAASNDVDFTGQTILRSLRNTASAAEANSQRALEREQELSRQLHAAEDRIADLEVEVQLYRGKAERAEHWLHKILTEVDPPIGR